MLIDAVSFIQQRFTKIRVYFVVDSDFVQLPASSVERDELMDVSVSSSAGSRFNIIVQREQAPFQHSDEEEGRRSFAQIMRLQGYCTLVPSSIVHQNMVNYTVFCCSKPCGRHKGVKTSKLFYKCMLPISLKINGQHTT